jgi:hypothetical protein
MLFHVGLLDAVRWSRLSLDLGFALPYALLEPAHRRDAGFFEQVAIRVCRYLNRGVAELLRHIFDRFAGNEPLEGFIAVGLGRLLEEIAERMRPGTRRKLNSCATRTRRASRQHGLSE